MITDFIYFQMNIIFRVYFWFINKANFFYMSSLKKRFLSCGKNIRLENTCQIIVPDKFSIGDNSSISHYTTIYATFGVTIGKNCLISSNCGISSYNHIQESLNRHSDVEKDDLYSKPVVICDNVWIGMNSCILPGVKIGQNSIIGSGSVVTKNVPPNEIWVGNPARFIKKIF